MTLADVIVPIAFAIMAVGIVALIMVGVALWNAPDSFWESLIEWFNRK